MGDDNYLGILLTASGVHTELGDMISQPNQDARAVSAPSAQGQSMNQPIQADEHTGSKSVSFINPDDSDYELPRTSATEKHDESRRTSDADTIKTYHQGIYWRSPITMVTFFLFGVFISVGHHLYYNSLVGQAVGDVDDQQRVLRSVATLRRSLSLHSDLGG